MRLIRNCAKLLRCHTQDLLDNKLIGAGKIEPMKYRADLSQTIEDVVAMYRMQASN